MIVPFCLIADIMAHWDGSDHIREKNYSQFQEKVEKWHFCFGAKADLSQMTNIQ